MTADSTGEMDESHFLTFIQAGTLYVEARRAIGRGHPTLAGSDVRTHGHIARYGMTR